MIERDIPATEQAPFFADFSKTHRGALITLRIGAREVANEAFRGVNTEGGDIIIHTGVQADAPHRVPHVTGVRLEQTDEGADAAIAMTSDDGLQTVVRFRSPIYADLLDPAVE